MAKRFTNLTFRGNTYYYRASFSLNRKTFVIRLSLDTADLNVARERALRIDRTLKRRWREVMATQNTVGRDEQQSIMRAAALNARDSLTGINASFLTERYEQPDEGIYDRKRSLRALEIVVRDLAVHGLNRDFGSRLYEMHLLDGQPSLDRESLAKLREVIEGGNDLAANILDQAIDALRMRNIDATGANVAVAAQQVTVGTLLALREAMAAASDPVAALDALLAGLKMPNDPGSDVVSAVPIPPVSSAGQGGGDATGGMTAVTQPPASDAVSSPGPPAESVNATGVGAKSIREVADAFLAAHPRYDDGVGSAWTPKTRSQFESVIFLAKRHFETTPVAAIDDLALAEFVRVLKRLPSNHHKTPAHSAMTLAEIAERGVGTRLGVGTLNRHVRFLKSVLEWAWKRIDKPPVVDWSAFIEADHRVKRDKRPAFTTEELKTLFGGAVWHGSESVVRRMKPGPHVWWDAPYWIPILLGYTGARREEIAKLMVADVEEIDGIWCIRIRPTEAGRVKNAAAERDIPLADAVVKLGFLDFVSRQREDGQTLLFPELRGTTGSMGDVFYKRWWRAFERAQLLPDGKDIHSIRHYVSTALAAAGVIEERRADLLGHTLQSMTAGIYTKRTPIPILLEVVNLLPNVTASLRRNSGPKSRPK